MCRMSAWENSRSSSFEGLVEKPIKREIDNVPELRLKIGRPRSDFQTCGLRGSMEEHGAGSFDYILIGHCRQFGELYHNWVQSTLALTQST